MIENIYFGMGLDRLFQAVLSFSFELMGENTLYIGFIPRLEKDNWFAVVFCFISQVVS